MSDSTVPPPATSVPPSINLVWQLGLEKIRDQVDVVDALDSKTGLVVGFVVVSIVEILGFLLLAAAEATTQARSVVLSRPIASLFVFGLLLSLVSTVRGFRALRVREFSIGYDYAKLVSKANLPEGELKAQFLDDLLRSVELNKEVLEEKTHEAKVAMLCAAAALMCYTIVVVTLTFAFVRGS